MFALRWCQTGGGCLVSARVQMTDEGLVAAYVAGDGRSFEVLWSRYQATVNSVSRRFFAHGYDEQDIAQEAAALFMVAISKFDPSRGVPFGAFATNVIQARLKSFIRDQQATKRRPTGKLVSTDVDDPDTLLPVENPDGEFGRVDVAIDVRTALPIDPAAGDLDAVLDQVAEIGVETVVARFYQPATNGAAFSSDETTAMLLMIDGEGMSAIAATLQWDKKKVDNTMQRVRKKLRAFRPGL